MTKALLLRGRIVQTSHSKRENTVIIYIVSMLFFCPAAFHFAQVLSFGMSKHFFTRSAFRQEKL